MRQRQRLRRSEMQGLVRLLVQHGLSAKHFQLLELPQPRDTKECLLDLVRPDGA